MALYQQRQQRHSALDEAAEAFRQAIRRFPTESRAHLALGTCLQEQGDWPEALSEYRAALRCRPDYAAAHRHLGQLLADVGRETAVAGSVLHLTGFPAVIDLALLIRWQAMTHLRHAAQIDPEDRATREALDRLVAVFPEPSKESLQPLP
jgi:tetratricopeptide (TPR) repeat protein